jgi:hypothetical protein
MTACSTHVPVCVYQQSTTPYVAVRLSVVADVSRLEATLHAITQST